MILKDFHLIKNFKKVFPVSHMVKDKCSILQACQNLLTIFFRRSYIEIIAKKYVLHDFCRICLYGKCFP